MKKHVDRTVGQVQSLSRGPPLRSDYKRKEQNWKDIYRIGNVVITDLRVFTIDLITKDSKDEGASEGWNKAIPFNQIVLGHETFGAPIGKESWIDNAPRIGLTIKELVMNVKNRMITEVTSNKSGALLHGALGEVFDFLQEGNIRPSPPTHRKTRSQG